MHRLRNTSDPKPFSSSLPIPIHDSSSSSSSSKNLDRRSCHKEQSASTSCASPSLRQVASPPVPRSYASVVRGVLSPPIDRLNNSGGTLTASLRRFAANLTSSLSGTGKEYVLLPSAPTDSGGRTSVSTDSEQSEDVSDTITKMGNEQDRGRPMKRPRSFPETESERRELTETKPDISPAVASRVTLHAERFGPRRQDYLHPSYNASTSKFSDHSQSRSRHADSKLSAHAHHSHFSHRSACSSHSHRSQSGHGGSRFTQHSQASHPSAMIRRPASTFVVGSEPREDGPSIVDMKTALVQRALDQSGMGRYQWCIFFLCGFGYALDLMWAQAFSLVTPRVQQELGISDTQYGDIFSVFSAGLTAGAFIWGILVDVIGRRWAFNLTVGIVAVFGIILGTLNSWAALCAVTFFVGFGLGGNIPIDATIVLEFLPNNRRFLLAALSIFQPIGVVITSLFSWALIPSHSCTTSLPACTKLSAGIPISASTCCTKQSNYGWRYALFTLGALSVLAFVARFGLFTFHESPKFLISKGRDEEAVEVVKLVRAFNKRKGFGFRKWWSRSDDRGDEEQDEDDLLTMENLQACEREWEEREAARERFERMGCQACAYECDCEAEDTGDRGHEQDRPIDGLPSSSGRSRSNDIGRFLSGTPQTASLHVKMSSDEVVVEPTLKNDATGANHSVDICERTERGARSGFTKVETGGWQRQFGHLSVLFSTWGMARLTLLTWVCYAADYWGFAIAGNFLPKFLADRGAAADQSTYDTYRNYIIIAVVGIPGVLLGAALIEIPHFGRKWSMVSSSALMGMSLFLYATITTPAASVGFNAMEYFFQSTFNAVLYGWTPEAFPAAVRGSACGLASFWGRLASIVAPIAAAHLGDSTGVLYLAGGGVFICTVTALFLPDTKESDVL